jgi:hypothetical protein
MGRQSARLVTTVAILLSGLVSVSVYRVQAQAKKPAPAAPAKMGGMAMAGASKMTDAQKIANAMSAAPAEIAKGATIMDWPATPDGKPRQLKAGTNGWVCFPNSPTEFKGASINDPMCLDKQWQGWADAWMAKKPPTTTATGIGYMLKGDRGASNTDPFATGPTATNQWVVSPPHIMVLYPDVKTLDSFSSDPKTGGPWVMWKGTPYAHLMVPVSPTATATMSTGK